MEKYAYNGQRMNKARYRFAANNGTVLAYRDMAAQPDHGRQKYERQ
jgi:hypothetical protein